MNRQEFATKVQDLVNQAYLHDIDNKYYKGIMHEAEKLRYPITLAEFLGWEEDQEYVANDNETLLRLHGGRIESKGAAQKDWTPVRNETRQEHFDWLRTLKKYTPRYIVPLPGLVTSDGEQQYLTHAHGSFFASRRNHSMRQTWKKEHLFYLPKEYRQYAVPEGELDED